MTSTAIDASAIVASQADSIAPAIARHHQPLPLSAGVQRRIAFASGLLPLAGPLLLWLASARRWPRLSRPAFQLLCFQLTMLCAAIGVWFVPVAGPLAAGGLLQLMMLLTLRGWCRAGRPQRYPFVLAWRWRPQLPA